VIDIAGSNNASSNKNAVKIRDLLFNFMLAYIYNKH
jgi:hypothetical protein